jgi:hypothetical protein
MKQELKTSINNLKSVYKNKKYVVFSIFIFIISLGLLLWLSKLDTLFVMNSTMFIVVSLLLTFLISLLFAINLPLIVYKYKAMKKVTGKTAGSSFFGVLGGLAGSGCPVCGSAILSLLGVAGGLMIFPLKGLELKALGVVLLVFSTYGVSKSIGACNTCAPKKERVSDFPPRFENIMIIAFVLVGFLIIFNQFQIAALSGMIDSITGRSSGGSFFYSSERPDISNVDVSEISSTAMAISLLFPELKDIQSEEDAINIMIPSGTPEYSDALGGITFDDPVTSLEYLAKWYPSLKSEIQQNDPETWQRYLNLAAAPRGISCEFCCGVGPQGITSDGRLRCGCKHNPAVQSLTLGLMKYTDYSDAEILREVMRWKTMFFPRNMVSLAMQVAGTDPSQLKDLPGMVGGC